MLSKIKERIKDLVDSKGMKISELAEKSELTEACIRNWYGARNYTPSLEALCKICPVLGITMAELFCLDGEMVPVSSEMKEVFDMWVSMNEVQRNAVKIHMKSYLQNNL